MSTPDHRPAVLLLHGLCANPLELLPLARRLRQAGYVVETPNLPGYGMPVETAHEAPPPVPPFEQWLDQARDHYDSLAARHAQVIVGGLGMGAVLALGLGLQRRPAALLLLSTPLHFDGWNISPWRRLLPLIARMPALRGQLRFREISPYGLKNELLRGWVAQAMQATSVSPAGAARVPAAALHQAERLQRYLRPHLHGVRAPSLILHASEDDVAGPRSVHELQAKLQQSQTQWFHDSYSMLTLDNERVAVAHAALQFLQVRVPVSQAQADIAEAA